METCFDLLLRCTASVQEVDDDEDFLVDDSDEGQVKKKKKKQKAKKRRAEEEDEEDEPVEVHPKNSITHCDTALNHMMCLPIHLCMCSECALSKVIFKPGYLTGEKAAHAGGGCGLGDAYDP